MLAMGRGHRSALIQISLKVIYDLHINRKPHIHHVPSFDLPRRCLTRQTLTRGHRDLSPPRRSCFNSHFIDQRPSYVSEGLVKPSKEDDNVDVRKGSRSGHDFCVTSAYWSAWSLVVE